MSLKVLVIPEDPTLNGYILKPLVEAVMADAGKPRAKVTVLSNPKLEGYDHALRAIKDELCARYAHWNLWLFIPDSDRATDVAMRDLEIKLRERGVKLLCSPAQPEVEIYACAAYRSDLKQTWQAVRQSTRLKEEIFEPLLRKYGDPRRAGGGRDIMIAKSLGNLRSLYEVCPELKDLKERIITALTES